MARLKERYEKEIRPQLVERFAREREDGGNHRKLLVRR